MTKNQRDTRPRHVPGPHRRAVRAHPLLLRGQLAAGAPGARGSPGGGRAGLTLPGAQAPDPLAAAAMLGAGAACGWYSLRGRRAIDGIAATADAFILSAPLAALV